MLGAGGRAAGQRAELLQVRRRHPVRTQIGVQEGEVSELVVGVVVDVLRHVGVEHRERVRVVRIATPAGNFAVLNATELVVLLPKVGFERLERGEEPQNRRISRGQTAAGEGSWRIR